MKNVLTYSLFCAILLILSSCSLLHREVVRATPDTAQSRICGKCHVEEYRELINQSNPEKTILSCQECHMPQIRRKLITQTEFLEIKVGQKVKGGETIIGRFE